MALALTLIAEALRTPVAPHIRHQCQLRKPYRVGGCGPYILPRSARASRGASRSRQPRRTADPARPHLGPWSRSVTCGPSLGGCGGQIPRAAERIVRPGSLAAGGSGDRSVGGMSTVTRRVSSRAGAPPSPRALPSFQSGSSRQRESSSVRRRAGLPMLMREVGSSRDVRARPARVLGAAAAGGGSGQCAVLMRPAAVMCVRPR
jgi:hypothetical protein